MNNQSTDNDISSSIISTYEQCGGNIEKTARMCGVDHKTVRRHLHKAGIESQAIQYGNLHEYPFETVPLPSKKEKTKRYILTSAQNNTHVHSKFWVNLLAYANHVNATIMVSTFTYNKGGYANKKKDSELESDRDSLWYDPEIVKYITDKRILLAPDLFWCGELNILPTNQNPLSGFSVYTGMQSCIFPHTKCEMRSIATTKTDPTKFMYTTGTVTQRNYLKVKAGFKAETHHCYGALIVEVTCAGEWFVRQILTDESGAFYDLDLFVSNGKVQKSKRVEAITWGDIHSLSLDTAIYQSSWGKGGIADALDPKYQFLHDILMGAKLNHHERGNPHEQFRLYCMGWESVSFELNNAAKFLESILRPRCETIVVDSNHDRPWIEKWLRETDYREDPTNAILFLELQLEMYRAIQRKDTQFHVFEHTMKKVFSKKLNGVQFLRADEPFALLGGDIECGMHGHLGPNGSRGSPTGLMNVGRKANTAHTHSAGIYNGLYVAGCSTSLDMNYNQGPSSWSNSHIVTYPNGKRTILTIKNGKWRG